ncbi:ImuA family protein [Paremcibacter congregatus]|uniref:ImuA family protein n=1 Tax=Paremcibacter congregatus TaxID=2043170 RepID=UPI003A959577
MSSGEPARRPAGRGGAIPARADVASGGLSFGVPEIDGHLAGGGLRLDAIHEFLPEDFTARAAAYGFLTALIGRLMRQGTGPAIFCDFQRRTADRLLPFGPGLMALGLDPGRLIHVQSASETDFFWSLEEALTCSRPLAVVGIAGETSLYDFTESKRLNLRAQRQGKPLFLLRSGEAAGATACATRWQIGSLPGGRAPAQAGQSRRGFFFTSPWRPLLAAFAGPGPRGAPADLAGEVGS